MLSKPLCTSFILLGLAVGEACAQTPVVRRTVVEEFNGTACGFCPRGVVAMERLRQDYPDTFIGISLHQYKDTDPMYLSNYAPLPFEEAPSCLLDRKAMTDPYYGPTDNVCYGIAEVFEQFQQMETDVDVSVQGLWTTEARKQVEAQVTVRFVADADDYTVALVLTADSVSGTSSSWLQTNYYSKYTIEEAGVPADDPLADFCKGGKYGQSYTTITYNDVAIASSYASGVSKADILPGHNKAGDVVTGSYTLSLPTKTLIKNALNKDYIYVVAMVIDADGHVANAARTHVTTAEESGIDQIRVDQRPVGVAFDLQGRPHPCGSQADSKSVRICNRQLMLVR